MPALLNEQLAPATTEWEFGTFLLHQEDRDHFMLLDPENRDFQPLAFLRMHGIDGTWTFEQETVGDVLITHLYR